ncbi:MAG: hypothetical protein EPO02_02225 [Nitrospirae bacterium]|nr:MAG: hypothetical protein EPO02_02225 [Nitrospirota bacterium]
MTKQRRLLRTIGRLGILSSLAVVWLGGLAWANITVVKQAELTVRTAPSATTPHAAPDSLAPSSSGAGDSARTAKKSEEKSTAKARLLVILLKMFEGYRGASP